MLVQTSRRPDGVTVLTLSNPPVNALSSAVQSALSSALSAALATDTAAIVLASAVPAFFSGGADVAEFASITPTHNPFGPETSACYTLASDARVPVVAAVAGPALGGGLELALCCAARVAGPRATFGLPEVSLGIIPGLGGTQRLPRLVGFEKGVGMMLSGKPVGVEEARAAGLVDEVVVRGGDVVEEAVRFALDIAVGKRKGVRAIDFGGRLGSVAECRAVASRMLGKGGIVEKLGKRGILPQYRAVVDVALKGAEVGGREGIRFEKDAFQTLVTGDVSKSIVHLFFASRATAKVDLGGSEGGGRVAKKVGVIGGGLMGAGIATCLLGAGCVVVIKEVNDKFLPGARARVEKNLGAKGKALLGRLQLTSEYGPLGDVDIVIEAALEDPKLKAEIFNTLEKVCKKDCILATNTSTINIDLIGAACPTARKEGRVVGAHFFSPAHKMPLLEIVRTPATSPRVVKDLLALAKKMRKTPVVVGNCAGFAVNRMYFPQGMVANFLVSELGLDPFRIDAACEKFGLPMGPFRLMDLVGLDISVAVNGVFSMSFAERAYGGPILESMLASGRKGQKSGSGFYKYSQGSRAGVPDVEGVAPFIEEARKFAAGRGGGSPPQPGMQFSDREIVEMILLPCVNEGCRILNEGVAIRPSDLDVCSCYGMAFPAYRGGLMKWAQADVGGPSAVLTRLERFNKLALGRCPLFKPSFCLERLVGAGEAAFAAAPAPPRACGGSSDIVVVSALRTAVARAGRGGFKDTVSDEMLRPIMEEALRRTNVPVGHVDDVVIGTVLGRGDTGLVQVRVASLLSGLPSSVPVKTVNRLCSSGLQAIGDAAAAIQAGHSKIVIAGGMESMSAAPMQNTELRPNPVVKRNKEAMSCYMSMGQTSENVAEKFNISRDSQDRLAVTSHARASAAKLSGRQLSEIVPIETKVSIIDRETKKVTGKKTMVVAQDEGVRFGVTMSHLAKLKPVFKKGGSTTAGNASQLSDGAAVVLVMERSEAVSRGIASMATLRSFAVAGVDPAIMGIGPVEAIPRALVRAGLAIADIDLFEINEAFGSQSDYVIKKLGLNRDIVNVNGGAIAIGHPLGMSGARLSVSIIHELHKRKMRFGVVSMCIGTGMGAAAVYEIQSTDGVNSAAPAISKL